MKLIEDPFPINQPSSLWRLKSVWTIICRLAGKLSSSQAGRRHCVLRSQIRKSSIKGEIDQRNSGGHLLFYFVPFSPGSAVSDQLCGLLGDLTDFFFPNLLTRKLQTSNKPSVESQLGPKEGATRVCMKAQLSEVAAKIHVLVILFSNASCCSPASPVSPDSNRTLARRARQGATWGWGEDRKNGLNLGHCQEPTLFRWGQATSGGCPQAQVPVSGGLIIVPISCFYKGDLGPGESHDLLGVEPILHPHPPAPKRVILQLLFCGRGDDAKCCHEYGDMGLLYLAVAV